MQVLRYFNLNQVAGMLQVSKQTIIRYENRGVFPKARRNNINNWREYTEDDIDTLKRIMGRG